MNRYLCTLAVIALGACTASREAPPRSDVIQWTAEAGAVRPAADGRSVVDVTLKAQVEPGWKLYSLTQKGGGPNPMTVTIAPESPYQIDGVATGPEPLRSLDPNFGIETETYSGEAAFRIAVKLPSNAVANTPIELKVRSQACSDKLCLPARTVTVPVTPAGKS